MTTTTPRDTDLEQLGINVIRGDDAGGRNGIVKATPLVAVENDDGIGPLWPRGDGTVDLAHESFAGTKVGMRVIVVALTVVENGKPGVDEGDRGQSACGCVKEELREEFGNGEVFGSPEGEKGNIVEVVFGADA